MIFYLLYRYIWKRSVSNTVLYYWDEATKEWKKIENDIGINNQNNPNNGRICLTPQAQMAISDEINKKLNEINACNCSTTCNNQNQQPLMPLVPQNQQPLMPLVPQMPIAYANQQRVNNM